KVSVAPITRFGDCTAGVCASNDAGTGLGDTPFVRLIVGAGAVALATMSVSPFDAVCCGLPASRTVTVILNVPATVGVPNSAPVEIGSASRREWRVSALVHVYMLT